MRYLQLEFRFRPSDGDSEQFIAWLLSEGFDSFEETESGLLAYIEESQWNEEIFSQALKVRWGGIQWLGTVPQEDKNWNELWEQNFQPVIIAGHCLVRAPFHPPQPELPMEVVIEPKMSFGTAHHETTQLVMEHLLNMELSGKRVLDMGCGTGILAILAAKLGAGMVLAIDNDRWAYENALENVDRNQVQELVTVIEGETEQIPGALFDVIIANINRNVLLKDMPVYARHTASGGKLLLSGFYEEDLDLILAAATSCGWVKDHYLERNRWVALLCSADF